MGRHDGGDEESQASAISTASSGGSSSAWSGSGGSAAPLDASDADGNALRPIVGHTPMEIGAGVVAAASVASAAAAMILNPLSNVVMVAGGLSCAIGPYSYFQQRRLTDVIALQETHAALREQIERLGRENARLHETVGELSEAVDKLEDVEQALDVITMQQGQSIAAFEEQVADNRDVLSKMQSNLRANVLQNLLQVVIRTDRDEDMIIEEDEIGGLIEKIQGINGVEVNEPLFRERIASSGGSIQSVMDIIKNLMSADAESEDEEIFAIKE